MFGQPGVAPCIAEIPALDELQGHYKDKNITFLSVSIDQEKDYQKWLDMIKEKTLEEIKFLLTMPGNRNSSKLT